MFGSGAYTFIWSAPDGSTSLERGTISTTMSSTILIFEAREEDTGTFSCVIVGSTGAPATATITVGNKCSIHAFCNVVSKSYLTIVPAILIGPVDMVLEYGDMLTTTFSCTAFGGYGAQLQFVWDPSERFESLSQVEMINTDNSTTSSITTNILSGEMNICVRLSMKWLQLSQDQIQLLWILVYTILVIYEVEL